MRVASGIMSAALIIVLCAGTVMADKQGEMTEFALKPWTLRDLPQLNEILADVNEIEPNDTCPGEAYALGDTYHAELTADDEDWVCFSCNAGDLITIGTDEEAGAGTVDTFIELWDNTCSNMLDSDDDGGPGLYSLIDGFEAPYTGDYYAKVRGFSGASTGFYTLVGNCVTPTGPGFCPIGTYKASKTNVNAVISDLNGTLTTPAIKFNPQPGFVITDVVIDMNIEHTWVGDLQITLKHTSSGGVVTTADLLNQPGVPETGFGCAGDLISDPENKYFFGSDPSLAPLGELDCPAEIGAACYAVAIENPGALEVFRGQPKGDGFWELCITDNAAGDDGFIHNWSVHLLCDQPISVEEQSWGTIKAQYRTD